MSDVQKNTNSIFTLLKDIGNYLHEQQRQNQEIPYLHRCFPSELKSEFDAEFTDSEHLSKDEIEQRIIKKYRAGVPKFRELIFIPSILIPTYVDVLQICRKRLRLSNQENLFLLEKEILQSIQDKTVNSQNIALRPKILPKVRLDPGPLLLILPKLNHLHNLVQKRVCVGVVGSPSAGKDTALRSIFGIDTGNIMPIAGSTKHIEIYEYSNNEDVLIINTPGMGDVSKKVTQRAVDTLETIDIYLYLLNSQGGLQAREYDDLKRCIDTQKKVIVILNKIDCLRPEKREEFIASVKSQIPEGIEVIPSCLDPLPGLMEPMGIEESRTLLSGYTHDFITELGHPESAEQIKELFLEPPPKPTSQSPKTVHVTSTDNNIDAVNIENMYGKSYNPSRVTKIVAFVMGLAIILTPPAIIIGVPILTVYLAVSGIINLGIKAKDQAEETVQAGIEKFELPHITGVNVVEDEDKIQNRYKATISFDGPNIENTSIHFKWVQRENGEDKTIREDKKLIRPKNGKVNLYLSRKKVKRGTILILRVHVGNPFKEGYFAYSEPITVRNQPLKKVMANISVVGKKNPKDSQVGDILRCEATAVDLDLEFNQNEVKYTLQWQDTEGNVLEENTYSTNKTIDIFTCNHPDVLEYTCSVKATDGEGTKITQKEIPVKPLEDTGDLLVYVSLPISKKIKRSPEDLDRFCHADGNMHLAQDNFMSWTSDNSDSPFHRFTRSKNRYIDKRKHEIAEDWCDLVTNGIKARIINKISTHGSSIKSSFDGPLYMYTRTGKDGKFDQSCPKGNCKCEWPDDDASTLSYGTNTSAFPGLEDLIENKDGSKIDTSNGWTTSEEKKSCENLNHVYCFQQGKDNPPKK